MSLQTTNATFNSTYVSEGGIYYTRLGNLVLVTISDVKLKSIPSGSDKVFASDLPTAQDGSGGMVLLINRGYNTSNPAPVRLTIRGSTLVFHYSAVTSDLSQAFTARYWYLAQ